MALTFRKGFKLGPVRVTLSRSGVGYSVGAFGLRVGKGARGNRYATADLPLGFRYQETLSSGPASDPAPPTQAPPFPGGLVDISGGEEFWFDIEGEANFQDNIVAAANEVEKHGGTEPIVPVFLFRQPAHDLGVVVLANHTYLEVGTVPASTASLRGLAARLGDEDPSVGTCLALIFDEDGKYGLKLNIERDLARS